jgi:hypothetical protein
LFLNSGHSLPKLCEYHTRNMMEDSAAQKNSLVTR